MPMTAIVRPPATGAMMREMLETTELSPIALVIPSPPTTS